PSATTISAPRSVIETSHPLTIRPWRCSGLPVALIPKHLRGRIVNGWLVSITVLGALIVVADGLTRPAMEWYGMPSPPFDYETSHAAVLFAAVSLPLMFAYARRARVSFTEGFLL